MTVNRFFIILLKTTVIAVKKQQLLILIVLREKVMKEMLFGKYFPFRIGNSVINLNKFTHSILLSTYSKYTLHYKKHVHT